MSFTEEDFRGLVAAALDELPEEFHRLLNNVEVVVEESPPPDIAGRYRGLLLGLYQGTPLNRRSHFGVRFPDKITIYKKSIERICSTPGQVKRQVRRTVMHEIGHHFGMNERQLREAGY